jgi:pimeloyl-ACP methyl ester carboxylesterase
MTIDTAGLEIAEFGAGEGDPLLLFHEGLGSLGMWRDFPDGLAAATNRPVIAWSRQGYGASLGGPDTYDNDFMHQEADAAAAGRHIFLAIAMVLLSHCCWPRATRIGCRP